jgi:hypothetical protein
MQMGTPLPEQRTSRKEKAVSFLKLASSGQVDQAYGDASPARSRTPDASCGGTARSSRWSWGAWEP